MLRDPMAVNMLYEVSQTLPVMLRDTMAVSMLYAVIQSLLVMLRDPMEVNKRRFPNGRWRNPSLTFRPH